MLIWDGVEGGMGGGWVGRVDLVGWRMGMEEGGIRLHYLDGFSKKTIRLTLEV